MVSTAMVFSEKLSRSVAWAICAMYWLSARVETAIWRDALAILMPVWVSRWAMRLLIYTFHQQFGAVSSVQCQWRRTAVDWLLIRFGKASMSYLIC